MTAWVLDREGNRVLAQDECETIVCTLNGSCRNQDILKIASLIAAAPDMLEALQALAEGNSPFSQAIARAAIAKATGG